MSFFSEWFNLSPTSLGRTIILGWETCLEAVWNGGGHSSFPQGCYPDVSYLCFCLTSLR